MTTRCSTSARGRSARELCASMYSIAAGLRLCASVFTGGKKAVQSRVGSLRGRARALVAGALHDAPLGLARSRALSVGVHGAKGRALAHVGRQWRARVDPVVIWRGCLRRRNHGRAVHRGRPRLARESGRHTARRTSHAEHLTGGGVLTTST